MTLTILDSLRWSSGFGRLTNYGKMGTAQVLVPLAWPSGLFLISGSQLAFSIALNYFNRPAAGAMSRSLAEEAEVGKGKLVQREVSCRAD